MIILKIYIQSVLNSPITFLLIAINILVAVILQQVANQNTDQYNTLVYHSFALVKSYLEQGEWWRLFTAMFIHFDIQHIGYNMISLYVLGTVLEKEKGSIVFVLIYFISGVIGNIMTNFFGVSFSAGASGAVFGLAGVLTADGIRLLFATDEDIRLRARKRWWVVFIYPLILLIPGLLDPKTNNIAHLFGFISGLLLSFIYINDQFQLKSLLRRVSYSVLIAGTIGVVVLQL